MIADILIIALFAIDYRQRMKGVSLHPTD